MSLFGILVIVMLAIIAGDLEAIAHHLDPDDEEWPPAWLWDKED
jgi:hypothetical protein